MSRRRARMTIRWARYFNHYHHIPYVAVGGTAAYRVVWNAGLGWGPFRAIRRQAKQRFVATEASPSEADRA